MDSTYIINVITYLISSQYVFAFVERPCTVSGVSLSRESSSSRIVREVCSESGGRVQCRRFRAVAG